VDLVELELEAALLPLTDCVFFTESRSEEGVLVVEVCVKFVRFLRDASDSPEVIEAMERSGNQRLWRRMFLWRKTRPTMEMARYSMFQRVFVTNYQRLRVKRIGKKKKIDAQG
jgi:hypothetical protein